MDIGIIGGTLEAIGEAEAAQSNVIVLNEGSHRRFHRHKFVELEWDGGRLGPDTSNFGEFLADFKTHCKCKCGRELIVTTRGLY